MEGRGYILVNSAPIPPGEQAAPPPETEWRQRFEAWRTFLAQCASKPNRKSVHALRALTLRLQVGLAHTLETADDPAAARAFQRWKKDAKKLRKALQPVRDADVYLDRLDSLRQLPEGHAPLSLSCAREIGKLEKRLRQERLTAIEGLAVVFGKRGKRLNRLSQELEAALTPALLHGAPSTAAAALRIFAAAASELPRLDAANLHEYRKRLKPALYLAEISASADPLASRLTAEFRKIQDTVGEWHDWHALGQKADDIFPGHGQPDGLVSLLQTQAEAALKRALGLCRRSTARYRKYASKTRTSRRKKPIAAERGVPLEENDPEAEICG
jgi:CHAD domain-containing protein